MAKKSYGRGGKDDEDEDDETEATEESEGKAEEAPTSVKAKASLTEKSVTLHVDKGEGIVAGMIASGDGLAYNSAVVRADGNGVVLDKPAEKTATDVDVSFATPVAY